MEKDIRLNWWREARYGMFIHWGLYSILGGIWKGKETSDVGEWIMKHMNIPVQEYRELAKSFNPSSFNADYYTNLAVKSGMKYIVFTAKHHDGFAMYHSQCSKYNCYDSSPFKRDPVKELAESCKKNNLKFCLYYSQSQDWDDMNGFGFGKPDSEKNFRKYLNEKCKPQINELLTNYGNIGLMWFDTPMLMTKNQSIELRDFVHSIQPNCIVSGCIGNGIGEYCSTSDNFIPSLPQKMDWEAPATLNGTWGFKYNDKSWKNPIDILGLLLRINSRGGNYLLNVGPDATGIVPNKCIDTLLKVGEYIRNNSDSIYNTIPVPLYSYDIRWAVFTARPYTLYIHILDDRIDINLPCFNTKILKCEVDNNEIDFIQHKPESHSLSRFMCKLRPKKENELARLIKLTLQEEEMVFDDISKL